MREHLLKLRFWYEQRDLRQRLLLLAASWVVLYLLYYYFIYSNIDAQRDIYKTSIAQKETEIAGINSKMVAINKLKTSQLYKDWLSSQSQQVSIDNQRQNLIGVSPEKQWQRVLEVVLQSQPNIALIELKSVGEKEYNPLNLQNDKKKLYAQGLILSLESDYYSFMVYTNFLEKQLPMIHWDKVNYAVTQYPLAKIDLEFSILYEKTAT